jgi:hypothetical protein
MLFHICSTIAAANQMGCLLPGIWSGIGVIGRAKAALAQRRMPSLFSTLSTVNP